MYFMQIYYREREGEGDKGGELDWERENQPFNERESKKKSGKEKNGITMAIEQKTPIQRKMSNRFQAQSYCFSS